MDGSLTFKARLMIFAATFLTVFSCSAPTEGNLTIGLILPYSRSTGGGRGLRGIHYASAITIAVDNINKDPNLLPGIRLRFIWDDSECIEEKSIKAFISQWERRVDAFIGFGCNCHTQARMAAALNLPVVSHVSMDPFSGLRKDWQLQFLHYTLQHLDLFRPMRTAQFSITLLSILPFSLPDILLQTWLQPAIKQLHLLISWFGFLRFRETKFSSLKCFTRVLRQEYARANLED